MNTRSGSWWQRTWPSIGARVDRSLSGFIKPGRFVERDQSDLPCPVPVAKIFLFSADPNQLHIPSRLVPKEGRIAIVTDAGRDAVDARASGAQWQSQGEMNLVSGLRRAR